MESIKCQTTSGSSSQADTFSSKVLENLFSGLLVYNNSDNFVNPHNKFWKHVRRHIHLLGMVKTTEYNSDEKIKNPASKILSN